MINKLIRVPFFIVMLIFLVFDLAHSFRQYYATPLDGDLPGSVVPAADVVPILTHPLGVAALTADTLYPNPNKYFSHAVIYYYFNKFVPFLQHFVSPIDSIYLACSVAKLLIQILLLWILSVWITGKFSVFRLDSMFALCLSTVFFQAYGYRSSIGIIDPSVTYCFFYALPILFLLLYFTPVWLSYRFSKSIPNSFLFLWIVMAPIVALSGPLNPGIALVVCFLWTFDRLVKRKAFSPLQLKCLIPIAFFSSYSLFLGQYNSLNIAPQVDVLHRYMLLPKGLWEIISGRFTWPWLFIMLGLNAVVLKRYCADDSSNALKELKWIGVFALCYLCLLPLGGYRDYRPFIIRYDTIMPITVMIIFWLVRSSVLIMNHLIIDIRRHRVVAALVFFYCLASVVIFENADNMKFENNTQQRCWIGELDRSDETIIEVPQNVLIATWKPVENPNDSYLVSQMLLKYNIISTNKLFVNKQQ